jgi:hypothetical protein
MIITSATVGFNSQHEKTSTDTSQQLGSSVERDLSLPSSGTGSWSSGTRVDLSYDARMRSEKASSVSSVSNIKSGDQTTQINQNHNIASLVETVIHKDAQIQSVEVRSSPVVITAPPVDLLAQAVSAQLYQATEQINIDEFQASTGSDELNFELAAPVLEVGQIQFEEARVQIVEQRVYTEHEKTNVGTQGVISTEDGREINFMLELEMERSFKLEESYKEDLLSRNLIDPLVINLHGGAAGLTNSSFSFDLNADGQKEDISFVAQGSGFLALDINNDGEINDGSELFGTQGQSGFSHLAEYDADNNQWIDENDEIFSKLKVWSKDAEGNDQLMSLAEAGVGAIYLGSTSSSFDLTDDQNNLLGQVKRSGVFLYEDGNVSTIQELDIAIREQQVTGDRTRSLADQYNDAINRLSQASDIGGEEDAAPQERLTLLDMLLTQERQTEELVARKEESSSNYEKQVTESHSKEEEQEFAFVDSERLSVLQRLSDQTEKQLVQERDKYDHLKEIIQTLRQIDNEESDSLKGGD